MRVGSLFQMTLFVAPGFRDAWISSQPTGSPFWKETPWRRTSLGSVTVTFSGAELNVENELPCPGSDAIPPLLARIHGVPTTPPPFCTNVSIAPSEKQESMLPQTTTT